MSHPRSISGLVVAVTVATALPAFGQAPPPSEGSQQVNADGAAEHVPAEASPSQQKPAEEQLRAKLVREGCLEPRLLVEGAATYAACGQAGVWVLRARQDGEWQVEQRLSTPGRAASVFRQGDVLWVSSSEVTARPLSALLAQQAGASVPSGQAVPAAAHGVASPQADQGAPAVHRVLAVGDHDFVVSTGRTDGLALGDRVEVFVTTRGDDLGGLPTEEERTVVIGEVRALSEDRARVSLGLSERVEPGQLARTTDQPSTDSLIAPPRVRGLWQLGMGVRPYLPLKQLGVAGLFALDATFRAERPAFVRVAAVPLGGLVSDAGNVGSVAARVVAGYDHQLFAVGVGAGVMQFSLADGRWTGEEFVTTTRQEVNVTVDQHARLGAVDGLHLSLTNSFVLFEEQFRFGWIDVRAQSPLASRTWLRAAGGGSKGAGSMFAEIGLRRLVRGNGRGGSLFVTPSVGLAGATIRDEGDNSFLLGPMVGVELEWRVGGEP